MYKVIIGLEVHTQLLSSSKNFSASKNSYTNEANVNVSVVDLGLPGILPTVNIEAVRKALKTAIALNCETPDEILFDRKNYYYPDLPKGYQITQMTKPFGRNGYIKFFVGEEEKEVHIHQLHLEEDTASLEHYDNYSLIDYNRCGLPLMEIVTEPCIYSADEAVSFLEALKGILLYTGVSEARGDKGQIRCDVNISLMNKDATEFGTKVEIKNINTFVNVKSAILYEIKRQSELLDKGEKIIQETRRVDAEGVTHSLREKVDSVDYKYFVEPNIPPIKIEDKFLEDIKEQIPELQYEKIKRYVLSNMSLKDAKAIARERELANYYDELYDLVDAKDTAKNWIISFVMGELNRLNISIDEYNISPHMLASVINLVNNKELNQLNAKEILTEANDLNKNPLMIIEEKGIKKISNKEDLIKYVMESINNNEKELNAYLSGKDIMVNFFLGQVMKLTNKQADPVVTLELIKEELERRK